MKKYKLLKDLPLYPAGTIGEIRKLDDGVESIIKVKNGILVEIINSVELRTIREGGKFDEWFEEVEDSEVWRPKKYDRYYYIISGGGINDDVYDDGAFDGGRVEVGNCFRTEEDAEKVVEKLKALRRLREKGLVFTGWKWNNHRIDRDGKYGCKIEGNIAMVALQVETGESWNSDREKIIEDLNLLFEERK